MSNIICTAIEAVKNHSDKIGITHLARKVGKRYPTWSYYDRILLPDRSRKIRVQREWQGAYVSTRWDGDILVELVPIDEVPCEQRPDNYRKLCEEAE